MRRHIRGIDHVVLLVRDLDRARDTWTRLGFALTPRGYHTLGSQNHCVVFERDYLELLAVPKPHPAMQYFTDFLAGGEGLGAVAFSTGDANAAQAELAAAGVAADPPLDFSRPVELPDGTRDAAFRIVQLSPADTPGCRTFVCQHFTPDLVWRSEYRKHALGALGIAGLAVMVENPRQASSGYARLLDAEPRAVDEGLVVETGSAPIALASRAKLRKRLEKAALPGRPEPVVTALFIRVPDRNRAADVLARGGFAPIVLKDGSLAIGADQAHGVAVVFG
jgi:catechol 2,3-dioxygenase-like lactoylglutathione lyase family enzyme